MRSTASPRLCATSRADDDPRRDRLGARAVCLRGVDAPRRRSPASGAAGAWPRLLRDPRLDRDRGGPPDLVRRDRGLPPRRLAGALRDRSRPRSARRAHARAHRGRRGRGARRGADRRARDGIRAAATFIPSSSSSSWGSTARSSLAISSTCSSSSRYCSSPRIVCSCTGAACARLRSGFHYVVVNLAASALFLIGIALLYAVTGTLNFADLAVRVPRVAPADVPSSTSPRSCCSSSSR